MSETPPVRTPAPVGGHLPRKWLPSIKAMAQEQLEGIANVSYGTVSKLTWSTATDWDNAVSEAGVVHEAAVTGYDLPGADVITLGYPTTDRGGTSLWGFYPGHEGSGTTLNDVSGNGRDGSATGATPAGRTNGFHGKNTWNWDGTDDYMDLADPNSPTDFSIALWLDIDSFTNDSNPRIYDSAPNDSDGVRIYVQDDGTMNYGYGTGTGFNGINGTTTLSTTGFQSVGYVFEGGVRHEGYLNGGSNGSASVSQTSLDDSANTPLEIGRKANSADYLDAGVAFFRVWTRPLTDSEMQAFHDAGLGGSLTTATKSFSSASAPDLTDLTYSLNGGGIDVTVIGSPGAAGEETNTVTLDGSTSFTLTWSNTHTDFRLKIQPSITAYTDAVPTFSAGSLTA